jgi:type IV pilus assembly protein PilQ
MAEAAPIADSQTLASEQAIMPTNRILADGSAGGIGVAISGTPGADRLVIAGAIQSDGYKVSRYHSPERVVIDLMNLPSKSSQVFDTADASTISRIRIGAHPDKSRIVLDLADSSVEQQAALTEEGLVIALNRPGTAPITQAAIPQAEIPTDATLAENGTTSDAAQLNTAEQLALAEEGSTQDASSETTLASISIERLGSSENMLVADLSSATEPTLERTAPSEFVLRIKNAAVGPEVAPAIIAPPETGAIRSVRPTREGNDVLLRVFTTPTTQLSLRSDANKLMIAAFKESDTQSDSEMMAQLAEEKAEAKTEAKPVEKKIDEVKSDEPTNVLKPIEPLRTSSGTDLTSLLEGEQKYSGKLISLDLQDTDIDNALRIIAEVSNLNIIASEDVAGKITLRLIDVPWDQALDVILKTNGLDKVQENNVIRIAPVEKLREEREKLKQAMIADNELKPLRVQYVRISYAKASDLKPLIETVLTERGTVAYDERTNQIIIKDIDDGIKNVASLIAKLDLRTPQVLLETQIVEASRSLLRELGSQVGFQFLRSPETGNATGWNFPNSISVGNGATNPNYASDFPSIQAGLNSGAGVNLLFGSADGTKSLDLRLTALETEGRARILSRPSVATTNNKAATIKAVQKIRIRLPSGGTSIGVGSGASASGSSSATETIEVGITLDVTPQASPDYYVLLDVKAKSSSLGRNSVDGIPIEIERSANSSVLVSSGQTFAMGGIYKITDKDDVAGVPFLKDVPFFGHFFRRAGVDNGDEEILFFLTPRIVEGSFDDAAMKVNG